MDPAISSRKEQRAELFAFVCGAVLLFLPLWVVYRFEYGDETQVTTRGTEVAVGIAVILRTTFRRLLRAGTSNLLRTSLGAFTRTTARTFTRRLVRVTGRFFVGILSVKGLRQVDADGPTAAEKWSYSFASLALGVLALTLSFWFIAEKQSPETQVQVTQNGVVPLALTALLSAVPLLVYVVIGFVTAWVWGARIRVHTAFDGLLLQGYFTGAGSFLPMTTDLEYEGAGENAWKISTVTLASLYLIHLALTLVPDSHAAGLLAAFFLIYCFVYSFPIRPLEGFAIWNRSKLLWVILWVPILISFIQTLPVYLMNLL